MVRVTRTRGRDTPVAGKAPKSAANSAWWSGRASSHYPMETAVRRRALPLGGMALVAGGLGLLHGWRKDLVVGSFFSASEGGCGPCLRCWQCAARPLDWTGRPKQRAGLRQVVAVAPLAGQARPGGGIAVGIEEEEEVRGRSRRRRILRARVTWPLRRGAATGGYRIRGFWTRRGALVACRCCCNVGLPGWI